MNHVLEDSRLRLKLIKNRTELQKQVGSRKRNPCQEKQG